MAVRVYTGESTATAKQVETYTVGAATSGQTFTITLKYEDGNTSTADSVSYANTGGETTSTIASKITSLCQESTKNRFKKVVFTVDEAVITATAATAGEPFYATVTYSPTSSLLTVAQTAENKGPNDWNDVSNWAMGVVPVAGDEVVVDTDQDISYGLAQSSLGFCQFRVAPGSTGKIGERSYYLKVKMTTLENAAVFCGTGEAFVDFGATTSLGTITVHNTAAASDSMNSGLHLLVRATHASTSIQYGGSLFVKGGDVGLATFGGELSQIGYVDVSEPAAVSSKLRTGPDAQIGSMAVSAGTVIFERRLQDSVAETTSAINVSGGEVTIAGTCVDIGAVNQFGGTVYLDDCDEAGGVTTYNLYEGILDTTRTGSARVIGTLNMWPGGTANISGSGMTLTNDIVPQSAGAYQVSVSAL